jgi:uncharacterized membrane protein YeiH
MDMFGVFVLAAMTAVGGGVIRDIIVGRFPPAAFRSSIYFWIIVVTMLAVSVGIRYFNLHLRSDFMNYSVYFYVICDAIGLGSFTVTGTLLGCDLYPDMMFLDITLGVLTAVGGGILRDLMAGRVPGIFKQDIYATASLAGAFVLYIFFVSMHKGIDFSALAAFITTVLIRLLAIQFHLNLPKVKKKRREEFF